jgi:hypothetical protein
VCLDEARANYRLGGCARAAGVENGGRPDRGESSPGARPAFRGLRLGLAWLGLAWLGLAWLGLAWLGLAWLGLAWLGLALPATRNAKGRERAVAATVEERAPTLGPVTIEWVSCLIDHRGTNPPDEPER